MDVNIAYHSVVRQIQAMRCDSFELGIYDRAVDKMLPRFWSSETLLKSVKFLKQKNSAGMDIYIRPAGCIGLVFFDDVNRCDLDRMTADGLRPAVIVQSSPDNFHGWIRISENPIATTLATAAAKIIAHAYGGDANSADWRHYGRLAGFTNKKPEHINVRGQSPFVKLHDSNGNLAAAGFSVLESANNYLKELEHSEAKRVKKINELPVSLGSDRDPKNFYNSEVNGIIKRYGASYDSSKADWMIVNKMISEGFSSDQIRCTLLNESAAVMKRGRNAIAYVDRTIEAAYTGRNQS